MASDVESRGSQRQSSPSWIVPATLAFVALGILTRLVRYVVGYPIWHDEAFLAVNFWDRDYADLLRPLDYGQVAPWLFLVAERSAVVWLGYSEMVLRLIPAVCGMLSVLVFYHVSGRLLHGQARLLAVAVFAVSFYPIRHGAEIKPYASDLLAALVLLDLAIEWLRDREASRWWWLMTGVTPILVALSYPVVFPHRHDYFHLDLGQDILGIGAMPDDNIVVWNYLNPTAPGGTTSVAYQFVLYSQIGTLGAVGASLIVGFLLALAWRLSQLPARPTSTLVGSMVLLLATYLAIDSLRNSVVVSYGVVWGLLFVASTVLLTKIVASVRVGRHPLAVIPTKPAEAARESRCQRTTNATVVRR